MCKSAHPFPLIWPNVGQRDEGEGGNQGKLVGHVKYTLKIIQPYGWGLEPCDFLHFEGDFFGQIFIVD